MPEVRPQNVMLNRDRFVSVSVRLSCCVESCNSFHNSDSFKAGIRFYRFPKIVHPRDLSRERRHRWLVATGSLEKTTIDNECVCSLHFVSGKPADPLDTKSPDWVPSLLLHRISVIQASDVNVTGEQHRD